MVGVSGVGLTLRDAFQGCIGEAIEYLSQLQTGTDLLLKPGIDDWAGKLGPKALELVAALSERRMQPERALSWCPCNEADRTAARCGFRPTSACGVRRRSATSRRHSP
jgi:ribosomal protein S12 methylthiotransferase accessory factor YcaO